MRKFHFVLEPLSRVRALAVREREIGLARAQELLQEAEEAKVQKEEELKLLLRTPSRGSLVHVQELLELDAERRRLRGQLYRALQKMKDSNQQVEAELGRLLDARRDEKVVGKLREKRYLEYLREALKQEQKMSDEVGARAFRKRSVA